MPSCFPRLYHISSWYYWLTTGFFNPLHAIPNPHRFLGTSHLASRRAAPQDTADPNPLVRALAIRTMSVLRAEKILDYLASPLSRCLRDENPYVRKTAALCVAKVFDLKPELCIEYGFIETLRDLIGDGNPMVSEPKGIMA